MYRKTLCAVLTSCLLAAGCSSAKELGKTLGDLVVVRAEIIKKFGEQGVNLRVNTFEKLTIISVTYINSPLNQKTTDDRSKRAQETAQIVTQHYPSMKNISQIWVQFVRATTRLVVFHWSETIEMYGFDNEARALRKPDIAPVVPSQPEVRYLANQDKTEISSSGIQLEGIPGKGLTFVTHFSVPGNLSNKIRPKPPAEVSLDFASFSEKPKFLNFTKIVFLSDDKIVYQTEDRFSTSKIGSGAYSEFLYLKVPTAAFLKITSGSTVKLRLNEHEYMLTESQLVQMKRMSDYLR